MSAASTAAERVRLSRERLRHAMQPASDQPGVAGDQRQRGSALNWLLGSLKSVPVASVLTGAVRSWWVHHPLRLAGAVAGTAVKSLVRPIARRNPFSLVLGALLVGALITWSRPWRWLLPSALLSGLLPRMLPRMLSKAVTRLPVLSWIKVFASLVRQPR